VTEERASVICERCLDHGSIIGHWLNVLVDGAQKFVYSNFCRKLCFDSGRFVSRFFILGTGILFYRSFSSE